eukprot:12008484-Alexandrium_andersonii.AAC.1
MSGWPAGVGRTELLALAIARLPDGPVSICTDSVNVARRFKVMADSIRCRHAQPGHVVQFPWADSRCAFVPDGDLWALVVALLEAKGPESVQVRYRPKPKTEREGEVGQRIAHLEAQRGLGIMHSWRKHYAKRLLKNEQ